MTPTAPANLNDVSTWSADQMTYAAPLIAEKATAAAKGLREEIAAHASVGNLEVAAGFAKIATKYETTAAFWVAVMNGESPKIPATQREVKVSAYEQTNGRVRNNKTLHRGPKDWGIWSR